jgi:hypothetical protein
VAADELIPWQISEKEIRKDFQLFAPHLATARSISVGRCIARSAQRRVIGKLRSGLKPLAGTNQYLVEAGVVDELLSRLERTDPAASPVD